jgi:hypothetical protein
MVARDAVTAIQSEPLTLRAVATAHFPRAAQSLVERSQRQYDLVGRYPCFAIP